jgi:hypothetical protein
VVFDPGIILPNRFYVLVVASLEFALIITVALVNELDKLILALLLPELAQGELYI